MFRLRFEPKNSRIQADIFTATPTCYITTNWIMILLFPICLSPRDLKELHRPYWAVNVPTRDECRWINREETKRLFIPNKFFEVRMWRGPTHMFHSHILRAVNTQLQMACISRIVHKFSCKQAKQKETDKHVHGTLKSVNSTFFS